MKIRRVIPISLLAISAAITQPLCADNWVAFGGAETLREFVSDARAEIQLRPGVTAIGDYYADGTAKIIAWDETFERTWDVVGDDRVCYTAVTETNCYTFEQNLDAPGQYRARHVETGELIEFQVSGTGQPVFSRDTEPDSGGGLGAPSAAELAAQLSNPNSNMGTLRTAFTYVSFGGDIPGAGKQSAFQAIFQPSLPYALNSTTNLFIRPAIPVIFSQDVPNPGGGFDSKGIDLGDISFDASVAKSFASTGTVFGGGIVGLMPTATDKSMGLDQWLLGPEMIGAVVRKWGVVGLLIFHQWDIAGSNDYDTSITGGQAFYVFNLKNGWQINGAPVFSYNHNASSGNKWKLPVGLGLSRTMIIKGRPWKFGGEFQYYVKTPDLFGPDWQFQFSVAPVVALPW